MPLLTELLRESLTTFRPETEEELLAHLGITAPSITEALRIADDPDQNTRRTALWELIRRAGSTMTKDATRISSPRAAGAYLMARCAGWTEERFGVLSLNAKGELLSDTIIGMGTATGLLISPREIIREGLSRGATTVLIYHNHPSGDPEPSQEDTQLTLRVRRAGLAVGVPLADHIVVGNNKYHSFRAAQGWDNGEAEA